MAEIGRKIYYEKSNGVVICMITERSGSVVETTFDEDKIAMPGLSLIDPAQIGVKQLEYGELSEEFQYSRGYRVNPVTEEIEFAN